MADGVEVLMNFWQEQRAQARQSEDQRAALSNLVLALAAAALGLIGQWGFERRSSLLSGAMILLGTYGALASAKYYERNGLHLEQAEKLADLIMEKAGLQNYEEMMQPIRDEYFGKHPNISRMRLNKLWVALHVCVAGIGVILTLLVLVGTH
jgi:hypothetical protein